MNRPTQSVFADVFALLARGQTLAGSSRGVEWSEQTGAADPSAVDGVLPHSAWVREQIRAELFGTRDAKRIGRYELERVLGRGGMGEVYLAHDTSLRRRVAIKLLRNALLGSQSEAACERARREALALAQVNHPNVVEVYEVGEHQGAPYVAMEYVEGRTLRAWLDEEQPSWREIVAVFIEAGRGLLAVHRAGLVHRDFKPDNVLISGAGDQRRVRVVDFGLARLWTEDELDSTQEEFDDDDRLTRAGQVLGTLGYMPLEQLRGEAVSPACDQFGFCVSLYQALWGQPPFSGRTFDQRVQALSGPPEPPPRSLVPRRLWRVVARGLASDPQARWRDMSELLTALEQLRAGWRTWPLVAVAGVALGAAVGLGVAAKSDLADADPCAHVDARSAKLWTDERAAAARARFEASGLSYADESFTGVDAALGEWTRAWSAARTSSCRDGEDRSPRARCLDRVQTEVAALIDALVDADGETVRHSVDLLDALPSLRSCSDDEANQLGLAPIPSGQELELERLRAALARAKALLLSGHPREADDALAQIERDVASVDYPPFAAELAFTRAQQQRAVAEPRVFLPLFESAAKQAEAARHDRLAALAWTTLAFAAASRSPNDADPAIERAQIASGRLGKPTELEARIDCVTGIVRGHGDDSVDEARTLLERSLDRFDAAAPSDPWRPYCLLELAELHDGPEALALTQRALDAALALYGEGHPEVARFHYAVARVLYAQQSSDRAALRRHLEAAAAIWLETHDDSSLARAEAHVLLATLAIEDAQLDRARAQLEIAARLYDRLLPPSDPDRAQPLLVAAEIAAQSGDLAGALDHYDGARALLAAESGHGDTLAQIDQQRAICLTALKRSDELGE